MSLFHYEVDFQSPWFLLLLLFAPLMWWFSFRSLAGLGSVRRMVVMALRTSVLVLLVLALAGIQIVRTSDRVTVIYLLDQSSSIPEEQRRLMIDYVNSAIVRHREDDDNVGLIPFAREPAVEVAPFDDDIIMPLRSESLIDPDYTNLAAALKQAQALFPEDTARRIVVVSDGNENLGDAVEQARGAMTAGIGIDVVPIRYEARAEVVVEKVDVPADVHKGQPFDVRVVINNTTEPGGEGNAVSGDLIIYRTTDDQPVVVNPDDTKVTLAPGKHVYTVRETAEESNRLTYEARWVPANPEDDLMPQNNRATAYTHVHGERQVLLIEDFEHPGEHDFLVQRLRENNIEVTVQPSNQLFTSLAELQQYDSVVLANVPKSSGEDAESAANFSEEQIKLLVRNTEFMGAGLIMLGGPNSFGAGGWANTELEKAMPVDFQIKSAKVVPKGALAMLMHASEVAQGNYWQKVIAQEALKSLGSHDYCGVLHWDGSEKWLWANPHGMIRVGPNRDRMIAKLDQMTPGDMPDFDPTMVMARKSFARLQDVAVKHMIIISDGDPQPCSRSVLKSLVDNKVTVSTVAVGAHGAAGHNELRRIANTTGGKYYVVNNNKALPRIFQIEARRVARPLVYENPNGMQPQVVSNHQIVEGIDGPFRPITGYVMTTKKESNLVETLLLSPLPTTAPENNTVLATWTYGLGKAVAFTSDAGARWSAQWPDWENYDKFFVEMVRWSMRPAGDTGKFTVATDLQGDKVRVIVTALDKDDSFLNFLDMYGAVLDPEGNPTEVKMEQTAPGRYVGEFAAQDAGSYFLHINTGQGEAPILTGVNVPYSAEFRDRETDEALLETLVSLRPEGGKPGKLIEAPPAADRRQAVERMLEINPFRRGELLRATSSQDAWYLMALLGGCLFFFDVFFRRVTVSFAWAPPLAARAWNWVRGREAQPAPVEYMQRLRSRKAEITEHIEQKRAAARFEPTPDAPLGTQTLDEVLARPTDERSAPRQPGSGSLAPEKEQESYTSRLLKAKKQVWDERRRE